MDTKNFIGMDRHGDYVFQNADNGVIKGFDTCALVELVCGTQVFDCHSWTHKVEINGVKLESGNPAAPLVALPDDLSHVYETDTVSCDECGAAHKSDGYPMTWTIVNECEAVCLGCRTAETVLVELIQPENFFKAQNLKDVDLDGYVEVESLFCDSSGFGSSSERAYTKKQAEQRVKDILFENIGNKLYAGITDMGQFQGYVTIFTKE